MEPEKQRRHGATRIWIRLAIAAGLVVGLVVLTFVVVVASGAVRESRAIEAVRARGEPLSPQELSFPLSQESDLIDRLQAFRSLFEEAPQLADLEFDSPKDFLRELSATSAWAGAVERVEQLLACSGDEKRTATAWIKEVKARLADPRHARDLGDCDRRLLIALAATNEPLLELAREVCSARPETAERMCRRWVPAEGPGPDTVASAVLVGHAVRVLSDVALARAIEGRAAEAQELLALGFRGANLVRDWPWHMGYTVWHFAIWNALNGLGSAMPALPVDADLMAVERELESVDIVGQLERAFVGERAFGNEMYSALRDGRLAGFDRSRSPPIRGPADLFVWSWIGHDRAFYLDTMGKGIAWTRRPFVDVVDEMAAARAELEDDLTARFPLLSVLLIPSMDRAIAEAAHLRARIHLARAAIQARREGSEAGARAADTLPDPFSLGSLQSRVEPDGSLVLWSIGPDRADDGGTDEVLDEEGVHDEDTESADIVWRVEPR